MGFMFYVGLGVFLIAGVLVVVMAKGIAARTQHKPASASLGSTEHALAARDATRPFDVRIGITAGAFGGIAMVVLVFVASNSAPDRSSMLADVKSSEARVVALTHSEKLARIRIGALSWSAEGFGTVMIATFRIDNDNTFPIKDVEVTCIHSGKSGTPISKSTRTVYEWINANSYHYVRDFNMGFFHGQAVTATCYPADFME